MFKGAITAIVTPFKNNKIDEKTFKRLIEFQIKNGIDGIVPCGTTGESATLSFDEHKKVLEIAVETVNKRVSVIAGAGSNNTEEALELVHFAKRIGADGALVITPYYNKPTQRCLIAHYSKISDEVDIPIVIYNVPSRTGINILPETLNELSKKSNIVAVKEASGSLNQVCEIINLCGDKINVLSGDDFLTVPMISVGAKGVISVASNVAPSSVSQMVRYALDGEFKKSEEIHYKLWRLFKALFIETNPIPVKSALHLMGLISNEIRLPLLPASEDTKKVLKKILIDLNLISKKRVRFE